MKNKNLEDLVIKGGGNTNGLMRIYCFRYIWEVKLLWNFGLISILWECTKIITLFVFLNNFCMSGISFFDGRNESTNLMDKLRHYYGFGAFQGFRV